MTQLSKENSTLFLIFFCEPFSIKRDSHYLSPFDRRYPPAIFLASGEPHLSGM